MTGAAATGTGSTETRATGLLRIGGCDGRCGRCRPGRRHRPHLDDGLDHRNDRFGGGSIRHQFREGAETLVLIEMRQEPANFCRRIVCRKRQALACGRQCVVEEAANAIGESRAGTDLSEFGDLPDERRECREVGVLAEWTTCSEQQGTQRDLRDVGVSTRVHRPAP